VGGAGARFSLQARLLIYLENSGWGRRIGGVSTSLDCTNVLFPLFMQTESDELQIPEFLESKNVPVDVRVLSH
jgi:hypothetical protein